MENNLGKVTLVRDINLGSNYGYFNSSYTPNDSGIYQLAVFKNKLYFSANNGIDGKELWVSDGTTGGTQLVSDIRPGRKEDGAPRSSNPGEFGEFIELKNKLYFTASDGENGRELWVTNGTTNGTQLLADIAAGNTSSFANFSPYYGYYFVSGNLTELNNKLYFTPDDGENGRELWVSDGTEDGTQLLKDINPGSSEDYFGEISPNSSNPSNFTEFNNKLYFIADDGENGGELWVSDGTENGTQLLKDINPGSSENYSGELFPYSSNPSEFTELNNKLYFTADDGENGIELWVSDGTEDGTQLLKDIRPGNYVGEYFSYSYSSNPSEFTELNNKLYFNASDGENGSELWVSDGTENGTQLLKDINSGSSENFDGESYPNSSYIRYLTELNNKLYFTADDGENGTELWVSDGTENGTQLLKDINPGSSKDFDGNPYPNSSSPYNLTIFNNNLYFTADDGENGRELWVSDGTENGTQLVADINPGGESSYINNLTVVGQELFFTANNGVTGQELFKLSFDNSTTITGTNGADSLNGNNLNNKIEGLNGQDTLSGLGGKDTLTGGSGKDSLDGGAGNDSLLGGSVNDTLIGGNGNDLLDGGTGANILTGGAGNDVFAVRSGNDRESIVDFQVGKDLIGLTGELEFDDLTFSGNTIKSGRDLLATLTGVETVGLTEADFTAI
jgi:ELWxxDGT repeat protein